MTSISNENCEVIHRGTHAEGRVTSEKICLGGENMNGACSGKKLKFLKFQFL